MTNFDIIAAYNDKYNDNLVVALSTIDHNEYDRITEEAKATAAKHPDSPAGAMASILAPLVPQDEANKDYREFWQKKMVKIYRSNLEQAVADAYFSKMTREQAIQMVHMLSINFGGFSRLTLVDGVSFDAVGVVDAWNLRHPSEDEINGYAEFGWTV